MLNKRTRDTWEADIEIRSRQIWKKIYLKKIKRLNNEE